MFAGVSYADVVKSNWCVTEEVINPKNGCVGALVKSKSCFRTCVPNASVKALNHSNSVIKRSDVYSNIKIAHSGKGVKNNVSNSPNWVPLELHNRFHVLNDNHDIKSHEVNSIHDIESHAVQHNEPSMGLNM